MSTIIKRDSFAKKEFVREVHNPNPGETCTWCGGKNRNGKLFLYWEQADRLYSRRKPFNLKPFCSIGCYRAFHN